jgi:uncharacterized protein YceK
MTTHNTASDAADTAVRAYSTTLGEKYLGHGFNTGSGKGKQRRVEMNKQTKTLLTILFVCVVGSFLSGCGSVEKTICSDKEFQTRNGLVYLPNQEEPFTGKNICKYENGQKSEEGNYLDGKRDGKWTWWYENGQKWVEANYKDGKMRRRTEWNENGIPKW